MEGGGESDREKEPWDDGGVWGEGSCEETLEGVRGEGILNVMVFSSSSSASVLVVGSSSAFSSSASGSLSSRPSMSLTQSSFEGEES